MQICQGCLAPPVARMVARQNRDRLEREAWEILKKAGEDVNQGEAPVVIEDVVCTRQTDKALLCGIDMIELWIPKSAPCRVWKHPRR